MKKKTWFGRAIQFLLGNLDSFFLHFGIDLRLADAFFMTKVLPGIESNPADSLIELFDTITNSKLGYDVQQALIAAIPKWVARANLILTLTIHSTAAAIQNTIIQIIASFGNATLTQQAAVFTQLGADIEVIVVQVTVDHKPVTIIQAATLAKDMEAAWVQITGQKVR